MLNSLQIFYLCVVFSQVILGMWGSGFLGLINCIHWIKRSKISLSHFIIMNLAFSRIIQQCAVIFDATILVFYPDFYHGVIISKIREINWTLSNYLNISLSTCLSVFYCLKIAMFSHPVFLWLKWRIPQVVACILLGSVLFFFFNMVLMIQKFKIYPDLLNVRFITNYTENVRREKKEYYVFHHLGLLWTLIPFIISLFSCLLLILSLRRHTRIMQHQVTAHGNVSTKAHMRATIVTLSFLLLFVFYLVIIFIGTASTLLKDTKWIIMIVLLAINVFATVHSFILIQQNKILKQAFLRLLGLKKGHMKGGVRGSFTP